VEPPQIPGISVVRRVGQGAHASVYEARRDDGARVALKHYVAQSDRAAREVALLSGLSHPNVLRVHDAPSPGCLVLDFVDGISVRELLRLVTAADEDVPGAVCAEIAKQTAAGAAALHDRGLVHCDLSASNVLLGHDGRVRIADFGSVTPTGGPAPRAAAPGTAPPEAAAGEAPSPAWDVYALGSLLFQLLTGRPPASALESSELLEARDDVPAELVELLYELWAEPAAERPAANETARRLGAVSAGPKLEAYLRSFIGPQAEPALPAARAPARLGFHISGAAIRATFDFVLQRFGAVGCEQVRARLSPETDATLRRHVDPAAWYDASVVVELTDTVELLFGARPGELARALGAASAEYALSDDGPLRVYRVRGLRDGVPAFLRSTEDLWGLYYDHGRWCVEAVEETAARVRLISGATLPPQILERVFAYLNRGLELVGARDIRVDREASGGDLLVLIGWRGQA